MNWIACWRAKGSLCLVIMETFLPLSRFDFYVYVGLRFDREEKKISIFRWFWSCHWTRTFNVIKKGFFLHAFSDLLCNMQWSVMMYYKPNELFFFFVCSYFDIICKFLNSSFSFVYFEISEKTYADQHFMTIKRSILTLMNLKHHLHLPSPARIRMNINLWNWYKLSFWDVEHRDHKKKLDFKFSLKQWIFKGACNFTLDILKMKRPAYKHAPICIISLCQHISLIIVKTYFFYIFYRLRKWTLKNLDKKLIREKYCIKERNFTYS